nr:hypothetical protein [Tanacetum cinerariifolium]
MLVVWRSFCSDEDDDYEETTIPLNEDIYQEPSSNTIRPVLPTLDPGDSLIIGNEELSTIPKKESDEFIRSSVEDLVPIPSESEDTSKSDSDDVELLLHCELSIPKMSFVSIIEVFTDEPPIEENDDLFDLESNKNKWKNILYDAPIDNLIFEDKIFDPGGDIDEIDAFLNMDVSTDIEDD